MLSARQRKAANASASTPEHGESVYEVRGFRSLVDFKIKLRSGLNVLVGPNGSGKTNFIEFLDFLDRLIGSGAANAVSTVGGVSRVFSQETKSKNTLKLTASVCSVAHLSESESNVGPMPCFRFTYKVSVAFNRAASSLYIASESIKFYHLSSLVGGTPSWVTVGVLGVTRSSRSEDLTPRIHIGGRLLEESPTNPLSVKPRYLSGRSVRDSIERGLFESMSPDESLLMMRVPHPAMDAVRSSITRGKVFNVIPEKVRDPDDITRLPGIARDGAGLTSTLFHLQEMRRDRRRRRYGSIRRATPMTIDTIRDWTRLVLRELRTLAVEQDPHSGKYVGYVTVTEKAIKIPLQSVSDGTLKWLSLVTMILTAGGVFSLEEPENFLHPKMQKYLVELIRESFGEQLQANHCIVSTHSETLLSECSPEDLILFRFVEGSTSCKRLNDPRRVQEEIDNSGFGLGYYYAANALS